MLNGFGMKVVSVSNAFRYGSYYISVCDHYESVCVEYKMLINTEVK